MQTIMRCKNRECGYEGPAGDKCPYCGGVLSLVSMQPEKVSSNPWMDALTKRSYTYRDMLEAWRAGRDNAQIYGNGAGDAPDFIAWLKERSASIR